MMKKSLAPLSLSILTILSGCASSQKIDHTRTDSVKRVAIIGFGVQQIQPMEGKKVALGLLGIGNSNGPAGSMTPAPTAVDAPIADALYADLIKSLSTGTGWQVLPKASLLAHPAYRALHADKTHGLQPRPMARPNMEVFTPEGVIEGFLLTNLKATDRAALMKELDVDAVAIVTLNSDLINDANMLEQVAMKGKFRRDVGIRFALYDRTGDDPIWFDGKSREEFKGEGSSHVFGFSSKDELDNQAFQTAHSTFGKVVKQYKTM